MNKVLWILFCLGCIWDAGWAQDHHPWAQQFGARASFLGGAVVGGLSDNSAMFYNPGAFAFVEESNLSINTDVYKYGDAIMRDGAGNGIDVISRRLSLYPQMVSGLVTRKPDRKYRLGFVILTRHHANLDFSQRVSKLTDVVKDNPGDEYYLGSIDIQNQMSENWAGLCYSHQLNANWGLGITAYASYRNQRYFYDLSALTAWTDSLGVSRVASFRYNDALRVNAFRAFAKLGLHYRNNDWHWGLSVTTPTITILGWSRVQRELSYFGLGNQPDATFNDQQRWVPTEIRQPYAVAMGLFRTKPKYSFGFSAEYYSALALYRMIKAEQRQVAYPPNIFAGPADFLGFYHLSSELINFSLGGELKLAAKWWGHASIRTDFSSLRRLPSDIRVNAIEQPVLVYPAIDLYHAAAGLSFQRSSATLSFGLNFAFGMVTEVEQLVNFSSPNYPNQILGSRENIASLRSHSLAILIGYTYFFALLK